MSPQPNALDKQGNLFTKTPSVIVQKVKHMWTDVKAELQPFSTQHCFPFFFPSYRSILTKIFFSLVWFTPCLIFSLLKVKSSDLQPLTGRWQKKIHCTSLLLLVWWLSQQLWRNAGQMYSCLITHVTSLSRFPSTCFYVQCGDWQECLLFQQVPHNDICSPDTALTWRWWLS